MSFHSGELEVQQRAGVREMADQVGRGIAELVPNRSTDFLEHRRMVVIGTVDSRGRAWASVVTGAPGFVSVPDPYIVRLGSLPPAGDPLLENLASESHAAVLAMDFLSPRRLRVNGQGIIQDGAIQIRAEQVYGNCRRYIQERMFLGSRPDRHAEEATHERSSTLSATQRSQISEADTFFIATDHPKQGADVSHKGGDPGFVRVNDATHLSFPDYNGNNMFNTLGNIVVNPHAGLLFIDFDSGRTLQLSGLAIIGWSGERAAGFAGAERIVDFESKKSSTIGSAFHCWPNFGSFPASIRSHEQRRGAEPRSDRTISVVCREPRIGRTNFAYSQSRRNARSKRFRARLSPGHPQFQTRLHHPIGTTIFQALKISGFGLPVTSISATAPLLTARVIA